MFFLIVTIAIIVSARRMINQTLQYNTSRRKSTVIANKPFRLLEPSTVRQILGPNSSIGNLSLPKLAIILGDHV